MSESELTVRHLDLARSWLTRNGSVLLYGTPAAMHDAATHELVDGAIDRRVLGSYAGHTDPDRPLRALAGLFSSVREGEAAALPPTHRRTLAEWVFHPSPAVRHVPSVSVLGPAVLSLLRALAGSTPLLLVLEAVQELDRETRGVLRFVAERAADLPMHVLAVEQVSGLSAPLGHSLCPPPLVVIRIPPPSEPPSPY
jgi:hypothetical protein